MKPKEEELEQNEIKSIAYTGQNKGRYGLSGYANAIRVEKIWGYELIYQNHELYCCKILHIYPNSSCSYHLHMEKHETLLVTEGVLLVDSIRDKKPVTYTVKTGEAFVVAPGFIHSLRAETESVTLVESSTPSYDTDSIRIKNGDNA